MGFKSSIADPDIWMRPNTKPDGEEYHEYIVCYVDDVLRISMEARQIMQEIQKDFRFKKDKIEPPKMYLGVLLEKKKLNGRKVWTMNSKDCIKLAIANVEGQLRKRGLRLPTKVTTPMNSTFSPELDISEELDGEDITFYQEIIGMLRWAIEIGRVDINFEISLLSSYQAAPRTGHLEQLLHILAFLKKKPKLTIYFDPSEAIIDKSMFKQDASEQLKDHYSHAE